jgi:hypothetical protein
VLNGEIEDGLKPINFVLVCLVVMGAVECVPQDQVGAYAACAAELLHHSAICAKEGKCGIVDTQNSQQ